MHTCMWTCIWTNDIVLGGQNVVFLRVIMYRFVFYHVSPVPVVKFIPFSCEMYAILFHADFIFFLLVNKGKCMFISKLAVLFLFDSAEKFI